MQTTVQNGTLWDPKGKTIVTRLSGEVGKEEIEQWERSLYAALAQIEDGGRFRILVDLYGFKAIDFEAHKYFRNIIPLTLARYGWKVGYVDLFEEASSQMRYSNERGIQCIKAAHVHQDETKIGLYERSYSRTNERYFTEVGEAMGWLG